MSLIDVDKLVNDIAEHITVKAVSRVLAIIQGQPTVDAVEVVRCKDCKFYEPSPIGEEFGWCNYFDSRVANNHYCSYGERRKDDGI